MFEWGSNKLSSIESNLQIHSVMLWLFCTESLMLGLFVYIKFTDIV
jgi:hypothetical protein